MWQGHSTSIVSRFGNDLMPSDYRQASNVKYRSSFSWPKQKTIINFALLVWGSINLLRLLTVLLMLWKYLMKISFSKNAFKLILHLTNLGWQIRWLLRWSGEESGRVSEGDEEDPDEPAAIVDAAKDLGVDSEGLDLCGEERLDLRGEELDAGDELKSDEDGLVDVPNDRGDGLEAGDELGSGEDVVVNVRVIATFVQT